MDPADSPKLGPLRNGGRMRNGVRWTSSRPGHPHVLVIASFSILTLIFFGPVLFQGRQFGDRDAGNYYWPLHRKVQDEWDHGRWPLWEAEENAGMPLLGNPTAAVLYPGKLIFAALPYPSASRIYIVAHTSLAFLSMFILMRTWRAGVIGSGLGAISYAFGAPIVLQSSNVIFLVGAAWLPLGIRAVDRWVRLGRRWGLFELTIVLAMQTLGGDPESAYLLGVSAVGYSVLIAACRARESRVERDAATRGSSRWARPAVVVAIAAWFAATVGLGVLLPGFRPKGPAGELPALPWMPWMPSVVAGLYALATLGFLARRRGRAFRDPVFVRVLGLAAAAAVAIAVAAAQVVPCLEYTRQTGRAGPAELHDVYPYSLEPVRLAGMVWPNIFGLAADEHSAWGNALPFPGRRPLLWASSLYFGGLTLLLGASTLTLRWKSPVKTWLSTIAILSLIGGMGQYGSPIWMTRAIASAVDSRAWNGPVRDLGPLDPPDVSGLRADGRLRDGDGGLYWWLTLILPGFGQFRFPSKLLVFTVLSLSALAGLGWDSLGVGRPSRPATLAGVLFGSSLLLLLVAYGKRSAILGAFGSMDLSTNLAPFDRQQALGAILRGLSHATILSGLGLVLIAMARNRPRLAGALAIAMTTLDLGASNARLIVTVPQSCFDGRSQVLEIIEKAEREHPSPGPFRVHRMPLWVPLGWKFIRSDDRAGELIAWEVDTLQSKFGINRGISYTYTHGLGEFRDHADFFRWFPCTITDPESARVLDVPQGRRIVYYMRRSFDLWNTRYFVVPAYGAGWQDQERSYASFLDRSEVLFPSLGSFQGPSGQAEYKRWTGSRDFLVLRNEQEYPRAWIVHQARRSPTIEGTNRSDRVKALEEMIYSDRMWHDPSLPVFDPRQILWADREALRGLGPFLAGGPPTPAESVRVDYPDPQRVELVATLEKPGVVVLSDVDYPGWKLTIDGRPAPIHRVNRMMRGAAVGSGTHRLVYAYEPQSVRIGCIGSLIGLIGLASMAAICRASPVARLLAARDDEPAPV